MADRVEMLAATPAPILFITIHRRLVRSAAALLEGMTTSVTSLVALDHRIGNQRMLEGENNINGAGAMLERLDRAFPLAVEVIRDPSLLAGSRNGDHSVLGDIFSELGLAATVQPSLLGPFAPFEVAGQLLQDPIRRAQRVDEGFRLLVAADAGNAGWIAAPDELVRLSADAWTQLCAQHKRLARELATPGASGFMDAVLDILSKLSEGPFRRYGSVFAIATQVTLGDAVVLDQGALFKYRKLGDVHASLAKSAPLIVQGIDKVLRNAEAHYDYQVLPSAVRVRHLPPNAKSVADAKLDYLSHDDVVEQVLNLIEATLSMVEALLLFLANHPDRALRRDFMAKWAL